MIVLGVNAYHGDVSAALVRDGQLVAAVEEERFRRIKHWAGFPAGSDRRLPGDGRHRRADIDHFAVSRNPRAHLLAQGAVRCCAIGRRSGWCRIARGTWAGRAGRRTRSREALPARARRTCGSACTGSSIIRRIWRAPSSSRRSTRRPSARSTASATSSARRGPSGAGSRLRVLDRVFFPHSLGLLYLAITQYLGFPNYGDEFKVMGLAPYGSPTSRSALRRLIRLRTDGGFELDLSYFRHWSEGVR